MISCFKGKKHFQQQTEFFLDKGSLEVVVGQKYVHEGQDIKVEEDGQGSNKLIGEHVSAKQEFDGDDKEDVGNELHQPCPECHVDVDKVLFATASDDVYKG